MITTRTRKHALALMLAATGCQSPELVLEPDRYRDASAPDGGVEPHGDAGPVFEATLASSATASSTPALADFSLGPYPSAFALLLNGIRANATSLDTRSNYSHSAAQGYLVLATARLLSAARGRALPGGEAQRDELLRIALGEIDELRAASTRVVGGAPGFGLSTAWDAFGDGSVNPAYTNYAWQTGLVALGIAELLRYCADSGTRHVAEASRIASFRTFLRDMVLPYRSRFTAVTSTAGYFWYSFSPSDAKAVHNTSALMAMALHHYGVLANDATARAPLAQVVELLRNRMPSTPVGGYRWNYVDDGYPAASRTPEDIAHATNTFQILRYGLDTGTLSRYLTAGIDRTLLRQVWSGNPARLNAFVDGTTSSTFTWDYSKTAAISFAAQASAAGGSPELFDYARSILVSSYLTRHGIHPTNGGPYATQLLALATLFERRPSQFAGDSRWSRVAGPSDTSLDPAGGVRFYSADWSAPVPTTFGGMTLPARTDTALFSNVLVDVPPSVTGRIVVSITYSASTSGEAQIWNGSSYLSVCPLPASVDETGTRRWYRTTFVFNAASAFDYESNPLKNVLLQFTNRVSVHRIEATPM
jgi:hypothetical protein